MNVDAFSNIVGLVGVGLILIAYFLLQIHRINSKGLWFSLANLIGAVMILYSLMYHWNLASVVIEIAWIIISVIGIYKIYKC